MFLFVFTINIKINYIYIEETGNIMDVSEVEFHS